MATLEEWLQLDDETLALELGKVLTPGPWKHELYWNGTRQIHECLKCKNDIPSTVAPTASFINCSVPDPIKDRLRHGTGTISENA